jgi:hypothetical protein
MNNYTPWKGQVISKCGSSTRLSVNFFRKHKKLLGEILTITVDRNEMSILGVNGIMFLDGVNCGYIGEGPNGTKDILQNLGLSTKEVWKKDNIKIKKEG